MFGVKGVAPCGISESECGDAVFVICGAAVGVAKGVWLGISFVLGVGAEQLLVTNITSSSLTKLGVFFIGDLSVYFLAVLKISCQLENQNNRNHDRQQYDEWHIPLFQNLVGNAM